jgi:hypothetical protein
MASKMVLFPAPVLPCTRKKEASPSARKSIVSVPAKGPKAVIKSRIGRTATPPSPAA